MIARSELLRWRLEERLELLINFINLVLKLPLVVIKSLHPHHHPLLVLLLHRQLLPCTFHNRSTLNDWLLIGIVWLQLNVQLLHMAVFVGDMDVVKLWHESLSLEAKVCANGFWRHRARHGGG